MKLFLFALIPVAMFAQAPANPLSAGTKMVYTIVKNNVLKSAEQMSEENYSFKPTPEVRSFGQMIGHIAEAQYEFCGPVLDGRKAPDVEKTKTSKADLQQALKDGFAYCDKAYDSMTDTKAAEIVDFFGRKSPKLTLLDFNAAHTDEHYGNLVTYMRMKGMTPPSSQNQK